MPVTVVLEHHEPKRHPPIQHAKTREEFLEKSCPYEYAPNQTHVFASSFSIDSSRKLYPSSSSFARSAIEAWARHSHLVIRPEDIWFQILVQLNFYMEKNGESLRDLFVSHQGKEKIVVVDDDWKTILLRFEEELRNRVKTPWLAAWVYPGFSTTNEHDNLTSIVLMMGLMSTFFEYSAEEICGIPSITLLGTKKDWEQLLEKIDRLQDFGAEPTDYRVRLLPILKRIVHTFEDPASDETRAFWDQLVHAKVRHSTICGEPPLQYTISGWIMGLFYWTSSGWVNEKFAKGLKSNRRYPGELFFDDVRYGEAYLEKLPVGYGKVAIKSLNHSAQSEEQLPLRWLVAGGIGKAISDGAPIAYLQQMNSLAVPESVLEKQPAGLPATSNKSYNGGRVSRLLGFLNCFRMNGTSEALRLRRTKQKNAKKQTPDSPCNAAATASISKVAGHSTIQPLAGWALFAPKRIVAEPFLEFEETWGPTVDAIDSCDNIEHYGDGAPKKRQAPRETQPYRLELNFLRG